METRGGSKKRRAEEDLPRLATVVFRKSKKSGDPRCNGTSECIGGD